ncbi:gpi-anchored protein [Colletotrichum kahawae]|uniref:Gpi-anchored protein n=1 Tax=Colletotrichum kahawae TaxID=34407 RepID=A0AAD9XXA0_COLKA|nr:gpi-anchored protein [Colletotrichum kahawae]
MKVSIWTKRLTLLFAADPFFATANPTPTRTQSAVPTAVYRAAEALLFRRQDCPAGTSLCSSSLGEDFDGVCCATGQVCAYDDSNNAACCPSGAVCTGAAPTTAPAAPTAVSYVPNSYFPFPFIATSLDRGECSDAVQQCSRNYESCVTQLDGDAGFGVTVVIPGGGGTTVAATRLDVGTSATPICASLSSRACHGIAYDQCSQTTTVGGVVINAAARPTPASMAGMVAGIGIAVFGAMR